MEIPSLISRSAGSALLQSDVFREALACRAAVRAVRIVLPYGADSYHLQRGAVPAHAETDAARRSHDDGHCAFGIFNQVCRHNAASTRASARGWRCLHVAARTG